MVIKKKHLDFGMGFFDMRLIAGEVSAEKFARFNALRFSLMTRNPDDSRYLEKKGWFIRTCVDIFIKKPDIFMKLAREVPNE